MSRRRIRPGNLRCNSMKSPRGQGWSQLSCCNATPIGIHDGWTGMILA